MKPVLSFCDMSFFWPGGTGLRNVALDIYAGDHVLVAGPSGAGKSTLLRLAARLEEPASGCIALDGQPLAQLDVHELRRRVGFIQQTPVVDEGTVRHNLLLAFGFRANAALRRPDDAALRHWLDRFLLSSVGLDDSASVLSVGQRQRLCIIRAMLAGPQMLLLDEPTSALDPESRSVVDSRLAALNAEGVTLLMVTHAEGACRGAGRRRVEVCGGRVREVPSAEVPRCTQASGAAGPDAGSRDRVAGKCTADSGEGVA
jgi:putative ABC transport system ATP-binding protein